jgi:hypothetical protein
MRAITASGLADLSKTLSGSHYIHCSYGPKYEIVLLSRNKPHWLDPERRTYSLPPFLHRIQCLRSTGWEVALELASTRKSYDFAQPLPGRRWLFVDSRLAADRAPNADIFDEKGTLLSSIVAGDGIQHVQATSAGDIWIGYFDEGVYSGGKLEGSGLVCLTEEGQPRLQYWIDVGEPNALPCIDDCYALNVSGEDEVWTSYYSSFPVVRLRRKSLDKAWLDFPAIAVRAFAVNGDRLLMTPDIVAKDHFTRSICRTRQLRKFKSSARVDNRFISIIPSAAVLFCALLLSVTREIRLYSRLICVRFRVQLAL